MSIAVRTAGAGHDTRCTTGTPSQAGDPADRRARRSRGSAMVTLLAVVLAALTVGLHDAGLLDRNGPATNHIGDDVSSSFGVVAVEFVRSVDGVTNRALAGTSHGVSGLVDASHRRIQVAVAVTNRSERPIKHSAQQFTLLVTRDGTTRALKPASGDLPDMRIQPHAGVEGHLGFTLPRKPVHLTLRYRDPGRDQPIVIDLGDYAARQANPEHQH